ncbi:hypothetical protein O181_045666 [Austropuccinia psidii MF-1]|uniref:Band 7 domain-containing protein n=1 Tax=Austropuccinia psidii MF-1 TaxID=1389203 RepID=A0A9Q3DKM6_9BASI|nr:hypothetical protein [Austropuccinia psidii MF-1]
MAILDQSEKINPRYIHTKRNQACGDGRRLEADQVTSRSCSTAKRGDPSQLSSGGVWTAHPRNIGYGQTIEIIRRDWEGEKYGHPLERIAEHHCRLGSFKVFIDRLAGGSIAGCVAIDRVVRVLFDIHLRSGSRAFVVSKRSRTSCHPCQKHCQSVSVPSYVDPKIWFMSHSSNRPIMAASPFNSLQSKLPNSPERVLRQNCLSMSQNFSNDSELCPSPRPASFAVFPVIHNAGSGHQVSRDLLVEPWRANDYHNEAGQQESPPDILIAGDSFQSKLISGLGNMIGCLGSIPGCFCFPTSHMQIQEGHTGLVCRFGKYTKKVSPGSIYVNPLSEILTTVDLKLQILRMMSLNLATKEFISVEVSWVVYWCVINPYKAAFSVSSVPDALDALSREAMQACVGTKHLKELLANCKALGREIKIMLNDKCELHRSLDLRAIKKIMGSLNEIPSSREIENTQASKYKD